ncbi:RIMS-binding protein 3C [Orycteropus afer afer]|uniref:RIMS-binding protein 3C n=1 Tax=Orycteropus afer afer TaxID=1230840 RepID=A0AC54ZAV1_ORYAF|nr:RIMS-binding protein 3C [Orycteropus afer afer]
MTKDYPSPLGGARASPKKPGSLGSATAVLEEQRREVEKLRAELEAERARGRAERRRFAAQARQLREAGERERQQLADHLRSKWEAQRSRELRQLQEAVLREREAEIRQLLRWKDAQLRQLRQRLQHERDGVVRQARALQRQLAEELVNRGYCSRAGAPEAAAAQCRCRLQDVLAQLRWETDGEQAARIRHLQAALDGERQLFLRYILEHFRWRPALSALPDPQAVPASEEPTPETASCRPEPAFRRGSLRSQSTSTHVRSRSLDLVPGARSSSPDRLLPTRASSFDSLAPAPSHSLNTTRSRPKASEAEQLASSLPDDSILGSPRPLAPPPPPSPPPPPQSPYPSEHRKSSDLRGGDDSASQPCEVLTPSPPDLDYSALVQRNSELAEALQVLARRCSALREENYQLRRAGFPDEAEEKVKRLKVKNAELTGLARRLEDRARQLQETSLRAVSAPVLGESRAGLELYQAFVRLRARDLTEQAGALLAKDKQIEELQQECYLLQARLSSGLGSAPLPEGGAPGAQRLPVGDLECLLRESRREVLRLQRQLVQQGVGGARAERSCQSAPCEEAQRQLRELERELGARRRECEELSAQAVAARRRGEEAEAQRQAALREGAWLAEENARLQAQADLVRKAEAENSDVLRQLGRACQERDASGLLAEQLLPQLARGQDRRQQLQHDLQKALRDLQAAWEGIRALRCQRREATQVPKSPAGGGGSPECQPGLEDPALPQPSGYKQRREPSLTESLVAPGEPASVPQGSASVPADAPLDSAPQAKKTSSNSSSEMESVWVTVPSCPNLDFDTASEVDDLESDSPSPTLAVGGLEVPATTQLKIKDCVYIFGDMDEDGFYEGELKDGQRIHDCDIPGCPPSKTPPLDPSPLLAGQGKALQNDTSLSLLPGKSQTAVDSGPPPVAKVGSMMEVEILDAGMQAHQPGSLHSVGEQGSSRAPLGAKGPLCVAPTQLELRSVTATSAEVTWVCNSSSHPHVVYLDDQEQALTPAGVSCYTFRSLRPDTQYQVRVEGWLPWSLLQMPRETMCCGITLATPLAGPPDPPLDVLVERHSSAGLLVVSWLPVTIDSAGFSNGVRVTGYAVYTDGLKVAEVASATAGNTLLDLDRLQVPATCQKVSVRTMSLCGESLDSVPALIPEDCWTCHRRPEDSSSGYICGHPSTYNVTFPICPQRLGLAPLSAETSPHTPESHGELQAEFLEAFAEEPPRRWAPVPSLSSEGESPSSGASSQAQGPREAREVCGQDLYFHKSVQDHRLPLPSGQSAEQENPHGDTGNSKNPTPGPVRHSPKGRPVKMLGWPKPSLEKVSKQKQDAHVSSLALRGPSEQCVVSGCHKHTWGVGQQGPREVPRAQGGQGQVPGGRPKLQVHKLSSVLCPALPGKVKTARLGPAWLGQGADSPAKVFMALFDYDPLMMSANPRTSEEELALQKGQLLRVGGSQDPNCFYRGQCSGRVGNIPGHPAAKAQVDVAWTNERWHLPAQGHLHSVGSFPGAQGDPKNPPVWTPKTMIASVGYDPRDKGAGTRAKGQLALTAGDVVTVYGPVDDQGFYYGVSGGHWGLVPAHLLDHMPFHGE